MKHITKKTIFQIKCDCGCGSQLQVMDALDNDLNIDCSDSGRSKWHGVYLNPESKKKLIDFIKTL